MLVDSHCHLDFPDFAEDLDAIVARAEAADPRRLGARDDGVEILGKIRKVEVAVAVDEHGLQTDQSAFGST